jgi:hypothetical protein
MGSTVKRYLIYAGLLVAALVTSYAFGRYAVPEKLVEVEKVKFVEVEKERVIERIDSAKLQELIEQNRRFWEQLTELKKSIRREEYRVEHPSGMVETRKTEDINIEKVVRESEIKYVDREVRVVEVRVEEKLVEVEKVVEKEVFREKLVLAGKPQWKITPMVGVNIRDIQIAQGLTTGPLTYGGMVERRIIGPVFAGVWGLSSGQAGIAVTVEF